MNTRMAIYAAIGCAIGATSGWYFAQVPLEACLGLVAGALLGARKVDRDRLP